MSRKTIITKFILEDYVQIGKDFLYTVSIFWKKQGSEKWVNIYMKTKRALIMVKMNFFLSHCKMLYN